MNYYLQLPKVGPLVREFSPLFNVVLATESKRPQRLFLRSALGNTNDEEALFPQEVADSALQYRCRRSFHLFARCFGTLLHWSNILHYFFLLPSSVSILSENHLGVLYLYLKTRSDAASLNYLYSAASIYTYIQTFFLLTRDDPTFVPMQIFPLFHITNLN